MNEIALGRYAPHNTIFHRLDPRDKLIGLIFLLVAVFFQYSTHIMTLAMSLLLFIIIFVMMIVSKTSIKTFFSSFKYLWLMIVLLLVINIFSFNDPKTYYSLIKINDGFVISYQALFQTIKIVLRLVNMFALTLILTSTTKPMELTNALEWFLTPFKIFKLPVHEISMTLSLALRFIPTLLDETNRIIKAQASRGVDFERGGVFAKFKAIISLIIPLFVSAFQRSEELSNAMEARGYNPIAKRTKYNKLHWTYRDTIAILVVTLLLAFFIMTSVMNWNYFSMLGINYPEVLNNGKLPM